MTAYSADSIKQFEAALDKALRDTNKEQRAGKDQEAPVGTSARDRGRGDGGNRT